MRFSLRMAIRIGGVMISRIIVILAGMMAGWGLGILGLVAEGRGGLENRGGGFWEERGVVAYKTKGTFYRSLWRIFICTCVCRRTPCVSGHKTAELYIHFFGALQEALWTSLTKAKTTASALDAPNDPAWFPSTALSTSVTQVPIGSWVKIYSPQSRFSGVQAVIIPCAFHACSTVVFGVFIASTQHSRQKILDTL